MMERYRSSPTDIVAQLQRRIAALEARQNIGEAKAIGVSWIPLTLQGAWVNYEVSPSAVFGPPAYMRDSSGIVHLRGLVKNGALGSTIATLPVGFRPGYQALLTCTASDAHARIDITTAGAITFVAGSNAWVSLWPLKFPAEK